MRSLKFTLGVISKIETFILVIFILFMIFFSFAQVVLRSFFDSGFPWADAMLRNMVLWVGFVGASLATQEDRHIKIDALTAFLSPTWKKISDCVTSFVTVGISCIFVFASVRFVRMEYVAETHTFLNMPFWIVQMIIPIGFGLISLRFLLRFLNDISCLKAHFQEVA
ncbi:MAG: TRAP transporter small permease [Deltaproteobacteria bacterium]|nr:TRAP transporter small permease [Deltaproteobacteria bacterium]